MASLVVARSGRTAPLPAVVSHHIHSCNADDYTWSDVHLAPFELHGLIALRAPDKSAHFNVYPRLNQTARCAMNWQKTYSPSVEALALNVLLIYSSLHTPTTTIALYRPAVGRGVSIVRAFGEDCLCSMPRDGGCIPLEALESWWAEYVRV